MVGVRGFEPPASASRTQRSSQTEPHPDLRRQENLRFPCCFTNISRFFGFSSTVSLFFRIFFYFDDCKSKRTVIFTPACVYYDR